MTMLSRSALFVLLLAVAACSDPAPADVSDHMDDEMPGAMQGDMPGTMQDDRTADADDAFVAPDAPPAFDGPALEVTLTPVGNTMAFEQTAMTAQPGQTVRITFQNTADNPAMSHNVVVLHAGSDVNAFGQAAMSAEATEYIPAELADRVIAHTALAAPGETVTVEFTAPAAGTYTYVCTFPGHYMMMTGTLTVATV